MLACRILTQLLSQYMYRRHRREDELKAKRCRPVPVREPNYDSHDPAFLPSWLSGSKAAPEDLPRSLHVSQRLNEGNDERIFQTKAKNKCPERRAWREVASVLRSEVLYYLISGFLSACSVDIMEVLRGKPLRNSRKGVSDDDCNIQKHGEQNA